MGAFPELRANPTMADVSAWAGALTRQLERQAREIAVNELVIIANADLTLVSDPAITIGSEVFLMPKSESAANEVATTFISEVLDGSFTVTHLNNAVTDRTFAYSAIESEALT